ncbi:MAG: type II toxin-antitoxin system HipA family toxin, partial [Acidobacteriaceae bacterium]
MLKVWADQAESGLLDRLHERGTTFSYSPRVAAERAVSVTMPVRLQSWDTALGLPPIFEMNLPEGALRERLRLTFAKATGGFDDYDLLSIVGRSQLGRIRATGEGDALDEAVPFQSVDEILSSRRGGELVRCLLDRFATASGISGVQPKVLVRDERAFAEACGDKTRLSESYRGATHIVKFWEPNEFPHLAANEYFCLYVAERCGLEVPRHRLAEDGMALVVDRFDLRSDGSYRGLEDFCVLNARRTDEKYRGSYETSVMKRFQQFANSPAVNDDLEKLFTLIALNCALRNGDAHLKNFAIVCDDVLGEARLAPVYDLVTTTVYLPADRMALTLNGSTEWPSGKELRRLGEMRAGATPARARQILEKVADALT